MKTLAELSDLEGRAALITGGAGHIALAASQALLELGADLALLDKAGAACRGRAKDLSGARRKVLAFPCDLEDEKSARKAVRAAAAGLGRLDIVVHCASYTGAMKRPGFTGHFSEQTLDAMEGTLRVNVGGALVLMQEARPWLEKSGHGSVLLVSSIHGMNGPDLRLYEGTSMSSSAGYQAAKAGLIQLARYFATVMAPKVRVNALSCGGVERGQPASFRARYEGRTPLGRMAVEQDLKGAVAYLASDLSAYVTGQNLVVDGGWTSW